MKCGGVENYKANGYGKGGKPLALTKVLGLQALPIMIILIILHIL